MAKTHDVFLYLGTYDSEPDAEMDLQEIKDLHGQGVIGTYDAAVVSKDDSKVHMHKIEKPTQHGGWTGLAVGAAIGVLFPPALIGTALVGAAGGGLLGHFARGMSRKDVKELGETLDEGQAALIVVGRDKLSEKQDKIARRALKQVEKELDIEGRNLEAEIAAASERL
ncbi:MAG TPA: DUF1269 domain-containing protein [Mycobacteriales bacterium]